MHNHLLRGLDSGNKLLSGKDTKAEARYTPRGTKAEHCGNCVNYEPPHCRKVQGDVVEGGWCKHWKKDE